MDDLDDTFKEAKKLDYDLDTEEGLLKALQLISRLKRLNYQSYQDYKREFADSIYEEVKNSKEWKALLEEETEENNNEPI